MKDSITYYSLLWYSTINTSCKNGMNKNNQRDVKNWYIIKKLHQKLLMLLYREIIYILIALFYVVAVHSSDVCSLDILI